MPSKRPKSPGEKKRLSYERDRRNTYGQNNKAARKAVPRFKKSSNRAMRHSVKSLLATDDERAEVRIAERTFEGLHPRKTKAADEALSKVVALKKENAASRAGGKARRSRRTILHWDAAQ